MTSYKKGMLLVTATSVLVPAVGLATAPILAHALGVAGRGALGTATAPNLLIVGGATLGLPQALTLVAAQHPYLTREALGWTCLLTTLFGGVVTCALALLGPYLAGGNSDILDLMLIGMWLAIPALMVGLLRGAAAGRQMWTAIAMERVINSIARLALIGVLAVAGALNVLTAVLVVCIVPVLAGGAYFRLAMRPSPELRPSRRAPTNVTSKMLRFASQVWIGSVGTVLLARSSQLLVAPLSTLDQLGLLIVAITIADLPYVFTQSIRDVAFGANSAEADSYRLALTSRATLGMALASSLLIGGTLPLWIGFVFGSDFEAAMIPTWLLLVASSIAVPGLIAGAGLDAAGRPGIRSASLFISLAINLVGILYLVPLWGAIGAALACLVGTTISSTYVVLFAARLLDRKVTDFLFLQVRDYHLLRPTVDVLVRTVAWRAKVNFSRKRTQ